VRRLALVFVIAAAACSPPPNLSQTDQPLLTNPAGYDFGPIQVGNTSAAHTTTYTYSTFGDEIINSVGYNCPDFIIQPDPTPADVYRSCEPCDPCTTCTTIACCPLDANSWQLVSYFKPRFGGPLSCTVTLYLQYDGTRSVTFSGTGTLPPVQLDVQPPSLAFGDVRRNTDSGALGLSVRNAGGGTMNVSSVGVSAGFTIMSGPTGAYQVPGGGSMPYSLVCHPTALGPLSGTFTIHSDDPTYPTKNIPLSCNGIDSALDIQPSPAALTTTRVGEPVTTTIQLKNTGTASMQLEGVTVAGGGITMTGTVPSGAINPGATKNLTASFDASTAGDAAATLTVTYDGGQTRTSQITARALATSMSMTPDGDVDFGPICVGQSKSQQFTVLANDAGSFKVSAVAGAAPFSATTPTLPFTVQGSGANKLMFDIAASPTAEGLASATATVTTDIPGATSKTVNLSVTGIAAGVNPNPSGLDFGQNEIDTTTIGQAVHLSNCSTGSVTFTRPRIEGTDAADFAIVAQPDSATIAASASASWLIVFQGHTAGIKAATFLVDYDGGTAMVTLAGESITNNAPIDPGNNPIDERSYYTCSSNGSGSSFGMLMFVVGLLVWRRRRTR
jgi:hypothetical protein